MNNWLMEQLLRLPLDSFTMFSMATASVVAYVSYQFYSRLFNVRYLKPSPHLHNQSVIVDREADIRTTVFERESAWDPNVVSFYEIFTQGLQISRDLRCLGQRSSFDEPIRWLTYEQVDECVHAYGSAMVHLCGLGSSDCPIMIGIYGRNSPEWVMTLMACTAYSFVAVPLYDTLGPEAMIHVCRQANPKLVVCDTAQLARNIIDWTNSVCNYIVVLKSDKQLDELRAESVDKPYRIMDLEEFMSIGRANWREVQKSNPDDLCLIGYTSGSTGVPKGVLFSHRNCLKSILSGRHILFEVEILTDQYVHFSYLPLAHCYERINVFTFLSRGGRVGFITKDVNGLPQDLQDYRPHYFSTVPRILMRIHSQIMQRLGTSKLLHLLYHQAVAQKLSEQAQGIYSRSGLLDRLFFKPIRDKVGGNVLAIVSASAPISNEVLNFTRAAFSCPVIEVYGLTEMGGMLSATLLGEMEPGHTGSPHLDLQVKLIDVPEMNLSVKRDGLGEICVKGEACTRGYFMDEENTRALFEPDGFLRTGDIGTWTKNGALKLIDRRKSFFKLAQGEYVTPNKVEELYSSSLLVNNVFVDGDSRETFVVAVVEPNFAQLRKRLAKEAEICANNSSTNGRNGTHWNPLNADDLTDAELCRDDRVRQLVLSELTAIGKEGGLKGFEQAKAIHLTSEALTIANGMLTPTMKISRPNVRRHFASVIRQLYNSQSGA